MCKNGKVTIGACEVSFADVITSSARRIWRNTHFALSPEMGAISEEALE